MRPIDADALKKDAFKVNLGSEDYPLIESIIYESDIDDANTLEVEPVRHGTWVLEKIIYDQDLFRCSECGRKELVYNRHSHDMAERYPYCHCGAKMDGGVKE